MKCPACEADIEKLMRGGLCPECNAPLKYVSRTNKQTGEKETGLLFRKMRDSVNKEETAMSFDLIYNQGGVSIEKSNDNYIVTYDRVVNFNWIYCPGCESKMFQNNMTRGSQEHKCSKCKSVTTYVFK